MHSKSTDCFPIILFQVIYISTCIQAAANDNISPETLYPYTLIARCGLRDGGPWPSLWQSTWEPKYHRWDSEIVAPRKADPFAAPAVEASKGASTLPSTLKSSMKNQSSGSARQSRISLGPSPQHEQPVKVPPKPHPNLGSSTDSSQPSVEVATTSRRLADATLPTPREEDCHATPPHRRWKGFVIPCWLPGCKNVIFQGYPTKSDSAKMHYCPE